MPVHFSPSSNHKEPSQLLQDELFPTSTFTKPHLSLSLNENQAVSPHEGLTLPGAINFYDMGWSHMPSDRQRRRAVLIKPASSEDCFD
ncbi:hypothetical protein TNCV_1266491 [Trichonephila clavipes]|nr:hypothetical protein TNCV_1266491 [Trichonephila clavipes]